MKNIKIIGFLTVLAFGLSSFLGTTVYAEKVPNVIWQAQPLTVPDLVFAIVEIDDINGDGISEVVIGSGGNDATLYLLSGKDGALIWSLPVGLAVLKIVPLKDINKDSYPDIAFIDMSRMVRAISGINGENIWRDPEENIITNDIVIISDKDDPTVQLLALTAGAAGTMMLNSYTGKKIWKNFYGGLSLNNLGEDIDGDSIEDIISAGVNTIYLLSGESGNIIWSQPYNIMLGFVTATKTTPELHRLLGHKYDVVGANMVSSSLNPGVLIRQIGKNGNLQWEIFAGQPLGFGRPLSIIDVSNDHCDDIVTNTWGPPYTSPPLEIRCLNGRNGTTIWSYPAFVRAIDGKQVISDINLDDFSDVIANIASPQFSTVAISGLDGSLLWSFNPPLQYSFYSNVLTPTKDLNGDSIADVITEWEGTIYALSGAAY